MTDVLGTLSSWDDTSLTVERDGGGTVQVALADVVTGKPVPMRGSTRLRVSPEHLEHICGRGWRALVELPLGEWLLRYAAGFTRRANSALIAGDPGLPVDAALAQVVTFYREQGLVPLTQVVVGSPWLPQLESRGWARTGEGGSDTIVLVASVAQARRVRRSTTANADSVALADDVDERWTRVYGRSGGHDPGVVRQVLTAGDVCVARIGDPTVAIGRGVVTGDWLGISAVEVLPDRRREGLAVAIVEALLSWGASRGALSAYLQTPSTEGAALSLYAGYRFTPHHAYRYLTPTPSAADDRIER